MATTLQKEYALIYYIRNKLGQTANNGFLHELYTKKNIKTILEALIQNIIKDNPTIAVDKVIDKVMYSIDFSKLTDPTTDAATFRTLPYSTVSLMYLYMGKIIQSVLKDKKQRLFIDDITEAKTGMAADFMSTFSVNDMTSPAFIQMVEQETRPDPDEIVQKIQAKYPDARNSEIKKYATQMAQHQFTNDDLDSLFTFIRLNYKILDDTSLTNGIKAVIAYKEKEDAEGTSADSFEEQRDRREENIKNRILGSSAISNLFKLSSKTHFVGTMKYKKNGSLDEGQTTEPVVELALRQQDKFFDAFAEILNRLLAIEGLPSVNFGSFGDTRNIILTETQYHALFPEYFITVGSIKDSVKSESEMGTTTMKSGDEASTVIDSYTGEQQREQEEDDDTDSYSSPELTLENSKKLVLAKMMATINNEPNAVPNHINATSGVKSMIRTLNGILITELFKTPIQMLDYLITFLTTGKLPNYLKNYEADLVKIKDGYLAGKNKQRNENSAQDMQVQAFAIVLSELAKLAKMDPENEYKKKVEQSMRIGGAVPPQANDITITYNGYTYILNNLSAVVNAMVEHAVKGQFIKTMPLNRSSSIEYVISFLTYSGLLSKNKNICTLETDTLEIKNTIDNLDWGTLNTEHNAMMADALRNCSYIYRYNGWEHMRPEEMKAHKFITIRDNKKKKTSSDDLSKLVSLITNLQTQIKPYVLKLRAINLVINRITSQYNIDMKHLKNGVDEPHVDLNEANPSMQMLAMDNTAESIDTMSEGYYIRFIIGKYEDAVSSACKDIRKILAENHLLNDPTRKTLISKVNNDIRQTDIINEVFDGVKKASKGFIAEDVSKMEVSNIFSIAQDIILLYNKVRNDVANSGNNQVIANSFPTRNYVTTSDLKQIADGHAPTGKVYTEDGSMCQNEFILNAYLIDILFEATYLLAVHFGLGGQSTYTTQDVVRKTDINEMKQYITANLNINVKNDASYKKLLTGILTRMNTTLFNTQMMNIIVPVITNFPNMKQLTVGEYNKINGQTTHWTADKAMQDRMNRKSQHFNLKAKREAEMTRKKMLSNLVNPAYY